MTQFKDHKKRTSHMEILKKELKVQENDINKNKKDPKIIALYLPQYHPTPDNDKWWGKGFTEWTNVGKSKPLFKDHYQPRVPADLGYYDLRIPEVREAQAELAKEAGVYGFCYYHYWFGNGKEELELPFDEVVKRGKPDFPFMVCWANESWHKKFWNKDATGSSRETLIEQTYPGEEDHIKHFYRLLPAFKDKRYIKIDNKLAFMIFKPLKIPKIKEFCDLWNSLAAKEGLKGFYFIGQALFPKEIEILKDYKKFGLDGLNIVGLNSALINYRNKFPIKQMDYILKKIKKIKHIIYDYEKIWPDFNHKLFKESNYFPTLIPNWDHSPRSGKVNIIKNSTPELFYQHTIDIFNTTKNKSGEEDGPVIFLKSWNEWGEGNYMEPDLKFGKQYIEALKKAVDNYNK